jgi:Tfp pilus assembly protein PilN
MKTHLNLLPYTYRRKQLVRARLRQWFAAWLFAAGTCAALAWTEWSAFRAASWQLDSLRRQCVPIENARQEMQNLEQRIAQLRRDETLALSLADEQPVLMLIGCLSRASRLCRGEVAVQELQLDRRGDRLEGASAGRVLILDGVATSHEAVARFSEELRNTNTFAQVELKQTGTADLGGQVATTYHIECPF